MMRFVRFAQWLVTAIISVVAEIIALPLSLVLPLFTIHTVTFWSNGQKVAMLPGWLDYFATWDNSIDEGHMAYESNGSNVYWAADTTSAMSVWWSRSKWLRRNACYTLAFKLFGAWTDAPALNIRQVDGWFKGTVTTQPSGHWGVHGVVFGWLRVKFGWKFYCKDNARDILCDRYGVVRKRASLAISFSKYKAIN
jgi:hypothetical protein